MDPIVSKRDAGQIVRAAQFRSGVSWAAIAQAIGKDPVWVVAALLGQHPLTAADAEIVGGLLALDPKVREALQMQPYRGSFDSPVPSDPTIYRLYEAINVYGPAIKELIHEEFGDGIMSAINFKVDIQRREDPAGDRVVITLDGKFLDYNW
ncbi:cyanase [Arthrobacter sp. SO3]|uniref:cyanase n=1 Tax=Arthrobacter sp. SO3 TaxID=1897057 RepID=UPI001D000BC2|nr:cyanase [Arthrobacter sp. SO3]MCB5293711.1 Cyanate hydratase [Arthrobacter sp. SO3]